MNHYLHKYVNQAKSSIGVTYVAVEEAAQRWVLGYFTIAMSSVTREAFPKKYVRGLPNYEVPLAQLAADLPFAGKGIEHALLPEALRVALRVSGEVGCRCVITDAYRDRVGWYGRRGGDGGSAENVPRYADDSDGAAGAGVGLALLSAAIRWVDWVAGAILWRYSGSAGTPTPVRGSGEDQMVKSLQRCQLRLPRSLKETVERLSREQGTSINQFVVTAVAEKVLALQTGNYFSDRQVRADFKAFDRIMRGRRGKAPRKGDEMPA